MKKEKRNPHGPAKASPKTVTVVNVRLLAILGGAFFVVGAVAYVAHGIQVRRLADSLLARAERHETEGEWKEAVNATEHYLRIHPDDAQAHIRLAEAFAELADGRDRIGRAVRLHDRAIGLSSDDERLDLMQGRAALLLRLGRWGEAKRQAEAVVKERLNEHGVKTDATDPLEEIEIPLGDIDSPAVRDAVAAAFRVGALAHVRGMIGEQPTRAETERAEGLLRTALAQNANDPRLCVELATLERVHGGAPAEADAIIQAMVDAAPGDAEVLLAALRYSRRHALPEEKVDPLIQQALDSNPDSPQVQLAAARHKAAKASENDGDYSEAAKHFRRAIELAPDDPGARLGLAQVLYRQGDAGDAQATLSNALRACGEHPELLLLLAEIQVREESDETRDTLARLDRSLDAALPISSKGGVPLARLHRDRLYGEWLANNGRREEAVALFERVSLAVPASAQASEIESLHGEAHARLGGLYAEAARWDRAAQAFDAAVDARPNNLQLRLAAAEAWAQANQGATAAERYRDAIRLDPARATAAGARVGYARELMRVEKRRPEAQRDWDRVRTALREGRGAEPDSWRLRILEADLCLVPGAVEELRTADQRRRKALELLSEAERLHPADPELIAQLVTAYEAIGAPDDADRALAAAERVVESPAALAALRSQIAWSRGKAEQAIEILTEALEAAPRERQLDLAKQLARLRVVASGPEAGMAALAEYSERFPEEPDLPIALLELTMAGADASGGSTVARANEWLERLGRTTVHPSVVDYYRGRVLLLEAGGDQDPHWQEAARLQASLEASRPGWSKAFVLKAILARVRGDHGAAADAMEQAVHLGETSPEAVAMLTDSLNREQRFAEATEYLSMLNRMAPESESLSSLAISVAIGAGDWQRALAVAESRVKRRPKDARARVWLGQALALVGRQDDAIAELRRAVELAPADMHAWNGLFSLYVLKGDEEVARRTLHDMVQSVDLSEAQKEFALAQGLEALQDYEQAQAHYERAAELEPKNPAIRIRMATMLVREDPARAADVLRPILDESNDARRMLAAILAGLGGEKNLTEALRLVEGVEGGDRRTRALLLARYGSATDRVLSRELFEEIVNDVSIATTTDRLVLAQLYEAEEKTQLAREQYRLVASQPDALPIHVAAFVDFLLRCEEWDDAELWMRRIPTGSLDAYKLAGLRVRLRDGLGEAEGVEDALEEFVQEVASDDTDRERRNEGLIHAAHLANAFGRFDLAENYFREADVDAATIQPALAVAVARQGRVVEAVSMFLEPWRAKPSARVAQCVGAVLMVEAESEEANAIAEPILQEALERFPEHLGVLNTIGAVRHLQGHKRQAIDVYRLALKAKPDDDTTLNNLVTLLSEISQQRAAAIKLVDRALQKHPDSTSLLDTKAMALLYSGRAEEAASILRRVVEASPNDPRYLFHLALAQHRLGEPRMAADNLERARALRLELQILTPFERTALGELREELSAHGDEESRADALADGT